MHNRANTNTDKAAAARFQRKLVRSRTWRRVAFSSLALFALVFTLLSFRLMAGLDPSSSGSTVATTSQPQTSAESGESADEDYDDDEDDDEDESFSADSTTSAPAPVAPTTRAS